jgi:hypothetical protein
MTNARAKEGAAHRTAVPRPGEARKDGKERLGAAMTARRITWKPA